MILKERLVQVVIWKFIYKRTRPFIAKETVSGIQRFNLPTCFLPMALKWMIDHGSFGNSFLLLQWLTKHFTKP